MKAYLRHIILIVSMLPALVGGSATISLLTCGEGREIYELEGHTALRIQHPEFGDFIVNWGVFDFNSPNFVYRFVKGETDYMAAASPTYRFIDSYVRQGRTVREQILDISPSQADTLIAMVIENVRPENRVYRYNYVLDNCATRPLQMIEKALGDTLRLGNMPLSHEDGSTFRNVMRHYHREHPWYQFGIDLALGSGIDRPITEREAGFAPVVLADMIAGATKSDGSRLVVSDDYAVPPSAVSALPVSMTPWPLTPMFWASVVFVAAIWVSIKQMAGKGRCARWFDTIYFSICGLEGLFLTFLIFVSVHEATSPNWLYLWLNPLCLIGAISPWLKRGKMLEICYQSVNFALLVIMTVVFIVGIQSPNPAFCPLIAASALRSACTVVADARLRKNRHS